MRAPIFMLLQLRFLEYVGELFADQVFLLFIKDVDSLFNIIKPRMVQDLFCGESLRDILLEHVLHEVARQLGNRIAILYFLLVQLVGQIADLVGFKRNVSIKDRVEANTRRPDIHWEALVADFLHDLGRNVGRRAALLEEELILVDASAHAEVSNLHIPLAVQ